MDLVCSYSLQSMVIIHKELCGCCRKSRRDMFLLWGIIETTALTLMFGMSPISAHVPFLLCCNFEFQVCKRENFYICLRQISKSFSSNIILFVDVMPSLASLVVFLLTLSWLQGTTSHKEHFWQVNCTVLATSSIRQHCIWSRAAFGNCSASIRDDDSQKPSSDTCDVNCRNSVIVARCCCKRL